jgi:sulfatase maturation enzyme AslB (radical SAM superfamily)
MHLSILYRGPLSSCNYACDYCPFAKHKETRRELSHDKECLARFLRWAEQATQPISILFTPWGEALIRSWYQEALQRLTWLPHVQRAVIQTNLSCALEWVEGCDKSKLALWATYHPTQSPRQKFLQKCQELRSREVRFSVGTVGLREHFEEISALRSELPSEVYLWVNAYKRVPHYYSASERDMLSVIDPLFTLNDQRHESLGHSCRAGASVISVDGEGEVTRCHFIKEKLGNLYQQPLAALLRERPCVNDTCGCHIGYVHLDRLRLYPIFAGGVLERIPAHFVV